MEQRGKETQLRFSLQMFMEICYLYAENNLKAQFPLSCAFWVSTRGVNRKHTVKTTWKREMRDVLIFYSFFFLWFFFFSVLLWLLFDSPSHDTVGWKYTSTLFWTVFAPFSFLFLIHSCWSFERFLLAHFLPPWGRLEMDKVPICFTGWRP